MNSWTTPKGTELPIRNLKGKDYLDVQWRLVWFREERPGWTIETDFLSITEKSATAKATIRDEAGRIIATAHKSQSAAGFGAYIEKSETGAVGRALAYCGFGTQFCGEELEEGEELEDLADSPAERKPSAKVAPKRAECKEEVLPECDCGARMMVSRFNPNELFCPKCRSKKPRVAA